MTMAYMGESAIIAHTVVRVLGFPWQTALGAVFIGVSSRSGFLDASRNLPDIEKPMLADALSTVVAALLGTSTVGAYIESATGIEEGGRIREVPGGRWILSVVSLLFFLS
jgi:xanthine/uracil/vitamin C permease (AzgA family)